MTDGRFDSSVNMRPSGWDTRRHWTKTHAPFAGDPEHVRDHMERESCPFHDLRADGCFQPEHGMHGDTVPKIEPDRLMKRAGGPKMRVGGDRPIIGQGMGGGAIPMDTDPAVAATRTASPPRGISTKAFSTTKKGIGAGGVNGLFGSYGHMPEFNPQSSPRAPPVPVSPRAFQAGGKCTTKLGEQPVYLPTEYSPVKPPGRPHFRLTAGKVPPAPLPPVAPLGDPTSPRGTGNSDGSPRASPRKPLRQREVFRDKKNILGTFGRIEPRLPDPEPPGAIRSYKPCIFTYAAKTKRTMPVGVPWATGAQGAEPLRMHGATDGVQSPRQGQTAAALQATQQNVQRQQQELRDLQVAVKRGAQVQPYTAR